MTRQKIKFTKMHGAGNDYIYVNTLLYNIEDPGAESIKWSAYHTGIGSDGLVLIGKPASTEADFSMRIFNADGSEAMMCGNASRCIGKYLFEKGITDKTSIKLETLSGIKILDLHVEENEVKSVTVDMLEPKLEDASQYDADGHGTEERTLTAGDKEFAGTFVSMGNPHFVIFVDDISDIDIAKYGSILENHKAFPGRCNIEFAEIKGDSKIRTRVWERGSGITMACGTGACATAVAAFKTGRAERCSEIVMDGGTLNIEWKENDNHVYMTGGATFVFEGEIAI
ncbi:MAG: diaminopimelate epimerase [Prevotellaceae bacterium]|nr:diaminopimelate epimerase [Prevotellaceae bacterium]